MTTVRGSGRSCSRCSIRGCRIGDSVGLATAHLDGDKLFLDTEKGGTKIYVLLPPVARDALQQIQNGSPYFFWAGNGLRRSAVADWQRALRRLFTLANVKAILTCFDTPSRRSSSKGVPTSAPSSSPRR
jgi:hypothetical protein